MDSLIKENERLDDLQCKGYMLIQKPEGFCFGIDAVLLAHFAKVSKGDRVLDLCTGSGVIPVLMHGSNEDKEAHYTGLEIVESAADMAKRSIIYNHLEEHIDIKCGDLMKINEYYGRNSFDVVTVNPPYMTENHGLKNDQYEKTVARHEILMNLEGLIASASYVMPEKGSFYMIHKPFRLAEIFRVMKENRIEPKRMRLVQPYIDKEPTMVLIEGLKGGRERITIEPPLIVYSGVNEYSPEIYEIYGKDMT